MNTQICKPGQAQLHETRPTDRTGKLSPEARCHRIGHACIGLNGGGEIKILCRQRFQQLRTGWRICVPHVVLGIGQPLRKKCFQYRITRASAKKGWFLSRIHPIRRKRGSLSGAMSMASQTSPAGRICCLVFLFSACTPRDGNQTLWFHSIGCRVPSWRQGCRGPDPRLLPTGGGRILGGNQGAPSVSRIS